MRGLVDFQTRHLQHIGICVLQSAQTHRHAGQQFLGFERLGYIVVRPGLQASHHVYSIGLCREHDDGDVGYLTQFLADLNTVLAGQHQVQQHQIWLCGVKYFYSLCPIGTETGHIARGLHDDADHLCQCSVVIYNQNFGTHEAIFTLFYKRMCEEGR